MVARSCKLEANRSSFDSDREHSITLLPTVSKRDFSFYLSAVCVPILNIFVPQVTHEPVKAGLPFFIFVSVGFAISFFALHFMQ